MDRVEAIARFLEQRARLPRDEAPIFYNDLAAEFDLPPVDDRWYAHPLCSIFGALDEDDQVHNRPFRTALVIGRERSLPGDGFFKMIQQLRGLQRPITGDFEQMRVWQEEFDRLLEYYE
jgi:hypothetical protein